GAVLAPHDRDDAELGPGRLAAEPVDQPAPLVGGDAVLGGQLRGRLRLGARHDPAPTRAGVPLFQASAASNSMRPSSPPRPRMSSQARSGCGMRPTTLPASLHTPAMLFIEPLGLAASVTAPSGSQ